MTRAIIPNPFNQDGAYFIRSNWYARINMPSDHITVGLETFMDRWKQLTANRMFPIDAALRTPNSENEFYIFSGTRYVRHKCSPSSEEDTILAGPHEIRQKWKSLDKAGFHTVDAVLPVSDPVDKTPAGLLLQREPVRARHVLSGEGMGGGISAGAGQHF
ncbi:hypothetical protein QBC43DRAFT_290103 [Cladorrhinum sp. PSN259]|nr:hypothetical protein QBC43DRAFT_290103 [Cladorrhinum sp. PSN259]